MSTTRPPRVSPRAFVQSCAQLVSDIEALRGQLSALAASACEADQVDHRLVDRLALIDEALCKSHLVLVHNALQALARMKW
jgi:hypothetical protein